MSTKATAHYHGHSKRGGIYKILNTQNGRFYYGSAKEFKSRWKIHLKNLRGGRHSNRFLQADFNKCGESVFEFHVVKVVPGDRKARTAVEDGYLKEHHDNQQQCYNFAKTADSLPRSVFSKDPEVTKKLLSEAGKAAWADPEIRAKRMKTMRSKEFRKKQSDKQKEVSQNPKYGNSAAAHKKRYADPKHREKHSQALKEAWANDNGSRREAASKVAKKVYTANKKKLERAKVKAKSKYHGKTRSPDGEMLNVYNLDGFCRKHGIKSSGNFWNMMHGRTKSCEGWTKV